MQKKETATWRRTPTADQTGLATKGGEEAEAEEEEDLVLRAGEDLEADRDDLAAGGNLPTTGLLAVIGCGLVNYWGGGYKLLLINSKTKGASCGYFPN